jgi:Haemin-degrading HemS.ChuX domain
MTNHTETDKPTDMPAETPKGRWLFASVDPVEVLQKLPQLDRIMLAIRQDDLLHERLGIVTDVKVGTDQITISGDAGITQIPLHRFAKTYLDISVEMRGKLYPRLEFHAADDSYLFSVTGLEGGAVFLPPLEGFDRSEVPMKPVIKAVIKPDAASEEVASKDAADEVAEEDAGLALLTRFQDSGATIEIRVANHGITQAWHGQIDKVMPMGGFVNIITKPFHLHLKAGQVAYWQSEKGRHQAIGQNGCPIGLEIKEL